VKKAGKDRKKSSQLAVRSWEFVVIICTFVLPLRYRMPKIYEYLGILFFFYSNEHEPVHVHGKYNEFEITAEFFMINGKIEEIRIRPVKGRRPLTGNKLNDFKDFISQYGDRIVAKWVDYFVYHKEVKFERINKPVK